MLVDDIHSELNLREPWNWSHVDALMALYENCGTGLMFICPHQFDVKNLIGVLWNGSGMRVQGLIETARCSVCVW